MATIIRSDLTVSGTYKLTDNVQVAPGVKVTVLPGATLDLGGFTLLITRTSLGRAQRACEQDPKMASLLGVDVDRTISITFWLSRSTFR